MNNYKEFEKTVKETCKKHVALIPTKKEEVIKLENGNEEMTIFLQDNKMVVKYRSHDCMMTSELKDFESLARVWKDKYSYKKYCLSILIAGEDWFFDVKTKKILGLINGMNVEQ